jgi:hypothetical protein
MPWRQATNKDAAMARTLALESKDNNGIVLGESNELDLRPASDFPL